MVTVANIFLQSRINQPAQLFIEIWYHRNSKVKSKRSKGLSHYNKPFFD
jgi:hypothetical protein